MLGLVIGSKTQNNMLLYSIFVSQAEQLYFAVGPLLIIPKNFSKMERKKMEKVFSKFFFLFSKGQTEVKLKRYFTSFSFSFLFSSFQSF